MSKITLPLVDDAREQFMVQVATALSSKNALEGLSYGSQFKVVCNLPSKLYSAKLVEVVTEDGVANIIRLAKEIKASKTMSSMLGGL